MARPVDECKGRRSEGHAEPSGVPLSYRHKEEQVADHEIPETVSREAHQRVLIERDQFKADLEKATDALSDFALRDRARATFKAKGAADPDWAADFALPHLRGVEPDKLDETLAAERFAPLFAHPNGAETEQTEQTEQVPPPAPGERAQSAFGGPTPGGVSPTGGPTRTHYRDLKRTGVAEAEIRRMAREGLVDFDPQVLAAKPPR
jgi:hypothetical protein